MARETRPFEKHLEDDLHLLLDPHATGTIPAWRMPPGNRRALPLVGGAGVAVGAKIATGVAIAVLAAGATTGIVTTHSVNPVDWAREVTQPAQPNQKPHQAGTSPATSTAQTSPKAQASPVVSAPAPPTVSAPPVPSVNPLPIPSPSAPTLP
jgi:hypothetical protein